MRFAIFPLHLSKVLRLPRKSDARSYQVLHLSRKIISANLNEDLLLQNATLLRKSAPRPPNSSDEHVSCTVPATENASLQILQNPHVFLNFEKVHNPLRLPRKTTSEPSKVAGGIRYELLLVCSDL